MQRQNERRIIFNKTCQWEKVKISNISSAQVKLCFSNEYEANGFIEYYLKTSSLSERVDYQHSANELNLIGCNLASALETIVEKCPYLKSAIVISDYLNPIGSQLDQTENVSPRSIYPTPEMTQNLVANHPLQFPAKRTYEQNIGQHSAKPAYMSPMTTPSQLMTFPDRTNDRAPLPSSHAVIQSTINALVHNKQLQFDWSQIGVVCINDHHLLIQNALKNRIILAEILDFLTSFSNTHSYYIDSPLTVTLREGCTPTESILFAFLKKFSMIPISNVRLDNCKHIKQQGQPTKLTRQRWCTVQLTSYTADEIRIDCGKLKPHIKTSMIQYLEKNYSASHIVNKSFANAIVMSEIAALPWGTDIVREILIDFPMISLDRVTPKLSQDQSRFIELARFGLTPQINNTTTATTTITTTIPSNHAQLITSNVAPEITDTDDSNHNVLFDQIPLDDLLDIFEINETATTSNDNQLNLTSETLTTAETSQQTLSDEVSFNDLLNIFGITEDEVLNSNSDGSETKRRRLDSP